MIMRLYCQIMLACISAYRCFDICQGIANFFHAKIGKGYAGCCIRIMGVAPELVG